MLDLVENKRQCIKGFGKERGTKIGDAIWWLENRHFFVAEGFYSYALFYVGRKTRRELGLKALIQADDALDEIIKTSRQLKEQIQIQKEIIKEQKDVKKKVRK
jgi:hypothetical protein